MRQFRHKTKGIILEAVYHGDRYRGVQYYKLAEDRQVSIPEWMVEQDSEWEEISDHKNTSCPHEAKAYTILTRKSIGVYGGVHDDINYENMRKKGARNTCDEAGCKIHSVRRESDGEVFTIDDKLAGLSTITGIKKFARGIELQTGGIPCSLETAVKLKERQRLFTAEDGVDIYQGDTFYAISFGDVTTIDTKIFKWEGWKNHKKFSSKKAAEAHIDYTKPKYSLGDIMNAYGSRALMSKTELKDKLDQKK